MYRKIFKSIAVLTYVVWLVLALSRAPLPKEGFAIHATQTDDHLIDPLLAVIRSATRSLYVSIYTLKDPEVLSALEKKIDEGVAVSLLSDQENCTLDVKMIPKTSSGLMHQKILVADEKNVWLATSNMTLESLYLDDNVSFVVADTELAKAIVEKRMFSSENYIYYPLPGKKKEALSAIVELLKNSKISIKAALFNCTHTKLIDAMLDASARGVDVLVAIDYKSAIGTSRKGFEKLGALARKSRGSKTLHHKFAIIDDRMWIMGSANWSNAAFSKNEEFVLIVKNLTKAQDRKLRSLWRAIMAESYS